MIALLQRVARAHVESAGETVGAIGPGALVLVCAEPADTPVQAERLVAKLLALRVFADAAGKMNLDLRQVGGGLLLVPQFTLAADTSRGNRPGFRVQRRRSSAAGSSTRCWPARAGSMPRWPPACSAPTCRCTWSTTVR